MKLSEMQKQMKRSYGPYKEKTEKEKQKELFIEKYNSGKNKKVTSGKDKPYINPGQIGYNGTDRETTLPAEQKEILTVKQANRNYNGFNDREAFEKYAIRKETNIEGLGEYKPLGDTISAKPKDLQETETPIRDFFKRFIGGSVAYDWYDKSQGYRDYLNDTKYSPDSVAKQAIYALQSFDDKNGDKRDRNEISEAYAVLSKDAKYKDSDLVAALREATRSWEAEPGKAAGINAWAAVTGMAGNVSSFANSLGADKIPGIRDITENSVEYAKEVQAEASRYNKGEYGERLGSFTQGAINLLPYYFLGAEKKGVDVALNTPKYAKYVSQFIKNPSFWWSLDTMWGQKYQEAIDEGESRETALANAVTYAVPAAMIEVMGGIGSDKMQEQGLSQQIIEEIGEELIQDIFSGLADKGTANPELPWFSTTEDAVVNPVSLAETAVMTAPIVALGGGVGKVINKASENIQQKKLRNRALSFYENEGKRNPEGSIKAILEQADPTEMGVEVEEAIEAITKGIKEGRKAQAENVEERFEDESSIEMEKGFENYPYDEQTVLKEYINSTNTTLLEKLRKFKANKKAPFERVNLSKVNPREVADVKRLTGADVDGYIHAINSDTFVHIENRHGENGEHDKSMANLEDVARVEYVLDKYDNVELLRDKEGRILTGMFKGKDNRPAPLLLYTKKINGTYYAAVAAAENKYKKLWIATTYIGKNKEDITQVLHADSSTFRFTSETAPASLSSENSISQNQPDVKKKDSTEDYTAEVSRRTEEAEKENINRISQIYREVRTGKISSAGRQGMVAYAENKELVERALENTGTSGDMVQREANTVFAVAYTAGLNGETFSAEELIKSAGVNAAVLSQPGVVNSLKLYHMAGISDISKQRNVKYWGEKSGLQKDDTYRKALRKFKLSYDVAGKLDALGKIMGHKVILVENLKNSQGESANAVVSDSNGTIKINLSADNPILNGAIHEIVHSIRKTDPTSYNKLARIVLEVYNEDSPQRKHNKELYKKKLEGKSKAYASDYVSEETVCKALGAMMHDSEMLNEFVQKDQNLAKRFMQWVHDLIVRVNAWASGDAKISAEQKKTFSELEKELRALEGILHGALNKRARLQGGVENAVEGKADERADNDRYDISEVKAPSIKEQIKTHLDDINRMDVVKQVEFIKKPNKGDYKYRESLVEKFRNEYRLHPKEELFIDRSDMGMVSIDEEQVRAAFRYLNTDGECSAMFAVPEVIKKGIRVDDDTHSNHKERKHPTYTIAAPISIGGQKGLLGVVLKRTSKLKYKVHRILMPDGKTFEIKEEISGYYAEMTAENDGESPAITTDSIGSIPQPDPKVKNENTTNSNSMQKGEKNSSDERFDLADDWNEKIKEFGTVPKGEKPARNIDVPNKISRDRPISRFARTMMEAGVTPDDTISEFEKAILDGTMTHEVITDKAAEAKAVGDIKYKGFEEAYEHWIFDFETGNLGKNGLVFGMTLYNQCIANKDVQKAMKIAAALVAEATSAGQTLQACRMLKKMTPDGQLYYLEKSVKKMNEEFRKKLGERFKDIELDDNLLDAFLTTENKESRVYLYDRICQDIADQIPSTFRDKWNSWRYLSMLGNPRTHIRNIIGNGIFTPVIRIKNFVAAVIEAGIVKPENRTKSIYKSKESVNFAKKDAERKDIKRWLKGIDAKYATTDDIESKRKIFKPEWLDYLRRKNFDFLEAEDWWFLKSHYVDALASAITARKIDVDKASPKLLDELRKYAVEQAQIATYRDANSFAEALTKLQRKVSNSKNMSAKVGGFLLEGAMPFKKTPMNIAKQGINYSPVSIIKSVYKGLKRLQDGEAFSASEVIDDFAKGTTGTGLMLLGFFLASQGLLTGAGDDEEKKRRFDKLTGEQTYALKIGDNSYTIEWATPSCLPLFVGLEIYNLINADGMSARQFFEAMTTLTDPLLELSVFSGVSDVLRTAQYEKLSAPFAIGTEIASSYILQALPTVLGQLARIIDPVKRNYYYDDKNSPLPKVVQNFIGQAASKIPFAGKLFEPSVDDWGREEKYGNLFERIAENLLSPGYYSKSKQTKVDKEINRLYAATGETAVFPTGQQKYYVDGEDRYSMTAEEYTEAKKINGEVSFNLIERLIKGETVLPKQDKAYAEMSDTEKVKAIKKCYEMAKDTTRATMLGKLKTKTDEHNLTKKEYAKYSADANVKYNTTSKYLEVIFSLPDYSADERFSQTLDSYARTYAKETALRDASGGKYKVSDWVATAESYGEGDGAAGYILWMAFEEEYGRDGAAEKLTADSVTEKIDIPEEVWEDVYIRKDKDIAQKYDEHIDNSDVDLENYLKTLAFFMATSSDKDADGKVITKKQDKMREYIKAQSWSRAEGEAIYKGFYKTGKLY